MIPRFCVFQIEMYLRKYWIKYIFIVIFHIGYISFTLLNICCWDMNLILLSIFIKRVLGLFLIRENKEISLKFGDVLLQKSLLYLFYCWTHIIKLHLPIKLLWNEMKFYIELPWTLSTWHLSVGIHAVVVLLSWYKIPYNLINISWIDWDTCHLFLQLVYRKS